MSDKYTPKAEDGAKEIHAKHLWMIRDEQAVNKKAREEAKKPKVVSHDGEKVDDKAPLTQKAGSEQPQNPSAPQHDSIVSHKETPDEKVMEPNT